MLKVENANLKNIEALAAKYDSIDEVKQEIKNVQSIKCRLKKQKARPDYESEMSKVVSWEQALKEVREYFAPKKLTVTTMTAEDIAKLNYDETMKAIKSIQSKKCNTRYLTDDEETNEEFQEACRIEKMLLEHKKLVKPVEETVVKKSEINDLIHHIENQQEDVSKEYLLKLLKEMTK